MVNKSLVTIYFSILIYFIRVACSKPATNSNKEENQKVLGLLARLFFFFFGFFPPKGMNLVFSVETQAIELH